MPSHPRAVVAACLLLGACPSSPTSKAPDAAPAVAAPSLALPSSTASDQLLALHNPDGSLPLDGDIRQTQRAAQSNPGKVDTWLQLGTLWLRRARESSDPQYYLHAQACAAIALALEPGNPAALSQQGLVLLHGHRFSEAHTLAKTLLAKDPENIMAWGVLSDALLELGDVEGAMDAAQHMVDLKPNLPSYSRTSHLRWLQGDTKGAKEIARLAIDAAGRGEAKAWALTEAAVVFWHEGDLEGADAGLTMALQQDATHPAALVAKGRLAMAHKAYSEAASRFSLAMQRQPGAETAWLLEDAHTAAGNLEGAKSAAAQVLAHGKAGDGRTLAYYLATRGQQLEEAVRLATKEMTVRPGIYTQDVMAWVLHKAGRPAEALAAIKGARKYGTPDARLLFHEGAIELAAGHTADGKALLKRALALNPTFDWAGAKEANALLASLPATKR